MTVPSATRESDLTTLSIALAAVDWRKFYRQELEDQMKPGALELLWNRERRAAWRRRVGLDAPLPPNGPDTVTFPIHHSRRWVDPETYGDCIIPVQRHINQLQQDLVNAHRSHGIRQVFLGGTYSEDTA